jgi:hypothetical protein
MQTVGQHWRRAFPVDQIRCSILPGGEKRRFVLATNYTDIFL